MEIRTLQKKDEKEWNEFVLNSNEASFCHLLGWRNVIKKSYGHRDLYLIAKEGKEIKGILPAFTIKHFFFGKRIISLPFCSYGGIIAKNKEAQNQLLHFLKDYLKKNKYDFFELRSVSLYPDLPVDLSEFTFILELNLKENMFFEKLNPKVRNKIRGSNKFGLRLEIGNYYLKDFYRLYQKSMKRLGTPVHSFLFFENISKEFPDRTKIFMAKFKNKFIAGFFLFAFKNILINPWGASDNNYSRFYPNNYLYWEVIKYAAESGFKYFDFGRSRKNSGAFNFKKQWGTEIKQLFYQRYSPKGKEIISDRGKYNKISKLWKMTPLAITNKIGPKLRKFIP